MTPSISSKQRILQAAASVVDESGAAHLTLEAVAEAAGLSKGGLLYHFPNKRALLSGMLEYLLDRVQERAEQFTGGVEIPGIVALIEAQQARDNVERVMSRAILAAAAEDPSLLDPAREALGRWFAAADQESPHGLILLLAIEGLRFVEMLNLFELSSKAQNRIYKQMVDMAEKDRL